MPSTMAHFLGAETKFVFDSFHMTRHVNYAVDSAKKQKDRKLKEKGMMDPYVHLAIFL